MDSKELGRALIVEIEFPFVIHFGLLWCDAWVTAPQNRHWCMFTENEQNQTKWTFVLTPNVPASIDISLDLSSSLSYLR